MGAAVVGAVAHDGPVRAVEQLQTGLGDRGEAGAGIALADPPAVGAEGLHGSLLTGDAVERRPAALGQGRPLDQ